MNSYQAQVIQHWIKRLGMSEGQVMDIARAITHNGALVSLSHMTVDQTDLLIRELAYIEARQELAVA